MDNQFPRLDLMGVKYSKGSFVVDFTTKNENNRNLIVLSSETKGLQMRFTLDDSDPTAKSALYAEPFELKKSTTVKALLFNKDKIAGSVNKFDYISNKASGKPVTIVKPYSFKYPGTGNNAMTDGIMDTDSFKSGWQGYEGTDMEFIVDLLQPTKISSVKLNFVKSPSDWAFFPNEVVFSISTDGKTWKILDKVRFDATSPGTKEIKAAEIKSAKTEARFIKVAATSPKVLPEWHEFKGEPCWIFADELIVE